MAETENPFVPEGLVPEKDDNAKPKGPVRRAAEAVLDFFTGSMIQLIPLIMAGGLFRSFAVVLGPDLLNLISQESPTYLFFNDILFDACFYFIPIYLGFVSARKIGATPVLGALMGGILISPDIVAAASEGGSGIISVYGFEIAAANYSQSVLPIMLAVPLIYVVERWIKGWMPDALSTIFTPFLTMVVSVPIVLIILAPLGNLIGGAIGEALFALADLGGFAILIFMAVLGAFWQLFVIAQIHMPIILLAQVQIIQVGYDPYIFVAANCCSFAVWGCALGAFLRLRDKDQKAQSLGYLVAAIVGGVTEPTLFGINMRYRRTFLGMFVGGAVSSVVACLLGVTYYIAGGGSNFLVFLNYLPGGLMNVAFGVGTAVLAVVVSAVVTYLFGFTSRELETTEAEAEADAVVPGAMDF